MQKAFFWLGMDYLHYLGEVQMYVLKFYCLISRKLSCISSSLSIPLPNVAKSNNVKETDFKAEYFGNSLA